MTRLRELRLKTGKTIKQVADEIGIASNYISQTEILDLIEKEKRV